MDSPLDSQDANPNGISEPTDIMPDVQWTTDGEHGEFIQELCNRRIDHKTRRVLKTRSHPKKPYGVLNPNNVRIAHLRH